MGIDSLFAYICEDDLSKFGFLDEGSETCANMIYPKLEGAEYFIGFIDRNYFAIHHHFKEDNWVTLLIGRKDKKWYLNEMRGILPCQVIKKDEGVVTQFLKGARDLFSQELEIDPADLKRLLLEEVLLYRFTEVE
jgi:hypothetical protein